MVTENIRKQLVDYRKHGQKLKYLIKYLIFQCFRYLHRRKEQWNGKKRRTVHWTGTMVGSR